MNIRETGKRTGNSTCPDCKAAVKFRIGTRLRPGPGLGAQDKFRPREQATLECVACAAVFAVVGGSVQTRIKLSRIRKGA